LGNAAAELSIGHIPFLPPVYLRGNNHDDYYIKMTDNEDEQCMRMDAIDTNNMRKSGQRLMN